VPLTLACWPHGRRNLENSNLSGTLPLSWTALKDNLIEM
jgi:hypothetical protein